MSIKLNCIVAVCENNGIGIKNRLPWKLKSEMAYFTKMTSETKDPNKKNITMMGRNTWEGIPKKFRPLANRINLVLTRNPEFKSDEDVVVKNSLEEALKYLSEPNVQEKIENVWVIGGSYIYDEVMKSKNFYRLYLTDIQAKFTCDTFFPALPENLKLVEDPRVPSGRNEEDGIEFYYKVYENQHFGN